MAANPRAIISLIIAIGAGAVAWFATDEKVPRERARTDDKPEPKTRKEIAPEPAPGEPAASVPETAGEAPKDGT